MTKRKNSFRKLFDAVGILGLLMLGMLGFAIYLCLHEVFTYVYWHFDLWQYHVDILRGIE